MCRRFSLRYTVLFALFIALLASPAFAADQVLLKSSVDAGQLRRVGASMEVGGHLVVHVDGKEERLQMQVKAVLRHQERLMGMSDRTAGEPIAVHGVRYYDDVHADISVDGKAITPQLRDERRLLSMTIAGEHATLTGLYGPLTREELDLVKLPGDSLVVDLLLPADEELREVDATWKHEPSTIALLLGLDAVGSSDVESKLFELNDQMAKVEMTGTVHGAVDGIATKIELRGRYYFDRQKQQISGMEMHWKEKRAVSHTSPGVDVTARIKLHLQPLATAPMLEDDQLEGLSLEPRVDREPLEFAAQNGRLRFLHDRQWHVTQEQDRRLTMRLVDDGDLVAQCNVLEQKSLNAGERISMEKFQQDIRKVLGEKFGGFRRAKETMNEAGHVVYHIQAEGKVSDMPIKWIYYLISAKDGRRVSLVFTMEGQLVEKFGQRDEGILATIELLEKSSESVASQDTEPSETATSTEDKDEGSLLLNPAVDRSANSDVDDATKG